MTIHHDLFEYVSSHITLDEVMYAEMNNQCPDEPWLEENYALSLWPMWDSISFIILQNDIHFPKNTIF